MDISGLVDGTFANTTGVTYTGNAGSLRLRGGLKINSGSSTGFNATGGGTVEVCANNGTNFNTNTAVVPANAVTDQIGIAKSTPVGVSDQNAGAADPAIRVQSGSSVGTDTTSTCADISSNTISGTWSLGTSHVSSIRTRSLVAAGGGFALKGFNPATEYPNNAAPRPASPATYGR